MSDTFVQSMNQPAHSSSPPRPLGPIEGKGLLEVAGTNGGPIRLPAEDSGEFIEAFNKTYQTISLKIERLKEDS